jgi:hypothetical protein
MEVYGLFTCLSNTPKANDVFIFSTRTSGLLLVLNKAKSVLLDPYTDNGGTTACRSSSADAYIAGFAMRLSSVLQARPPDD